MNNTMMTEEELISQGFEKIVVTDEDSNNGYDYYYYYKAILKGLSLHSSANIDTSNNEWCLFCFEIPDIKIKNAKQYLEFLNTMHKISI